jgi:uncharacterized membrane protein YfcA
MTVCRSTLTLAFTGIAGGFFSGLTGVGGGALMVPLLTGVVRMRQHAAHGTSLAVIVFAAAAGAATYTFQEGIDWLLVLALLAGSVAGAYVGARGVQRLPALRLRQVFGAFLLAVGLRLVLVSDVGAAVDASGLLRDALAAGIGLAGGLAAGALGVGGGAIFVPGLVLLVGVGQHEAQGISLDVIVVTAAVAAITHHRHGSMDLRAARWIVPTAVPAGILGAVAAAALDGAVLQRLFAVVVLAVGAQLLLTATLALRRSRQHRAEPVPDVSLA